MPDHATRGLPAIRETGISRRDFLQVGAAAGGGLFLEFAVPSARGAKLGVPGEPQFSPNAFIRIDRTGAVTLIMPQVEMGQGIYTSIAMILAEELDIRLETVTLEAAPPNDALYGNPALGFQVTGGSTSVRAFWMPLRRAGASARAVLIAAAASNWKVDPAACSTAAGEVIHATSGRRLPYGSLVDRAARLKAPANPTLKTLKEFRIIGTATRRLDTPDKVTGKALFGIDALPPGVRFATLMASPVVGGKVIRVDDAAARAIPGVRQIVVLDDLVAVVADHTWAAKQGLEALDVAWDDGPNAHVTTEEILDQLKAASERTGAVAKSVGDAAKELADAERVEATYHVPFLAHAPMEPMNCTVHVRADGCEIWVGNQVITRAQATAAKITGLPKDKVVVHNYLIGGGFGRRLEVDGIAKSVRIAQKVDGPVKVIWTREEDIQKALYRPLYFDRFEARQRVVAELQAAGLLERVEKHRLVVPRGDRSGAVLEPYLTDQWYVKIAPLAAPAIAAVEAGRTRFVPENWARTYFEWMRNIRDWCISRQLWWGHRIPAWYDADNNIYVGRSEPEVRARHQLAASVALRQDEDVLDTWFSSALWPFSTLGWPETSAALAKFYPGSVLVTGFDIIFFWVARMMMMGLEFMGEVPFRDVYITGLIRDEHGDKMSKSKGNVIDPLDIVDGIALDALVTKRTSGLMQPQHAPAIERATRRQYPQGIAPHGTDALRFTFAALASPSRDISFDLARVAGYRNFCNKLWNAARFVTLAVGAEPPPAAGESLELSVADRWIRARFGRTLERVAGAMQGYRFDYAATALYEFAWYDFCDWYLELTKPILQSDSASAAARRGARATLAQVLEALQRALHPLMPFITEEIWQRAAPLAGIRGESVMLQPYPAAADFAADEVAERETAWIQGVVLAVRQIRGEMNISPARRIPALLRDASAEDETCVARHRAWLERLAGLESITVLAAGAAAPQSAAALAGNLTVLVPIAGLIDAGAEIQRLGRLLARAREELAKTQTKLTNENFVRGAPPAVVATERERAAEFERTASSLAQQIERLRAPPAA